MHLLCSKGGSDFGRQGEPSGRPALRALISAGSDRHALHHGQRRFAAINLYSLVFMVLNDAIAISETGSLLLRIKRTRI
jgi:hypothetical protein